MGLRAYLLVTANDDVGQREFVDALLDLEKVPEVDFVDPVVGNVTDIVVMIEAPVSIEAVARKIEARPWVKDVKVLRIISLFERHKASKRELLKTLNESGI
jgi:hypothetical protein